MIKLTLFLICFSCAVSHASSTAATIAAEYFSEGKYSKVVSTCKEALEDDPSDKECRNLSARAKAMIDSKNAANKAKFEAAQKEQMARDSDNKRKRESSECKKTIAMMDYCSTIVGIETEKNIIDRENRVSKDTGSVNLTVLNKAGRDKSFLEDQSTALAIQYEKQFGTKPNPSMCKFERDSYGFPRADEAAQKKKLGSVCGEN